MAGWLTGTVLTGLAAASVVMLVGSLAVAAVVVSRLPTDYFRADPPPPAGPRGVARAALWLSKNLLGLVLVVLGIILSLPGVPGQGVLTILIGLMLLDVPGRRRAERWIASRPAVLGAMNALRARFGRPPLEPPLLPDSE